MTDINYRELGSCEGWYNHLAIDIKKKSVNRPIDALVFLSGIKDISSEIENKLTIDISDNQWIINNDFNLESEVEKEDLHYTIILNLNETKFNNDLKVEFHIRFHNASRIKHSFEKRFMLSSLKANSHNSNLISKLEERKRIISN